VNIATFGQRLQHFREQRGLTQLALAQRASVPQSVISDLEAGKREGVTLELAWRLALALCVSLDYLAGTWEAAAAAPSGAPLPAAASSARRRGRPRRTAVPGTTH
jgi:transcriptional regulator with XRE-family HTH domain